MAQAISGSFRLSVSTSFWSIDLLSSFLLISNLRIVKVRYGVSHVHFYTLYISPVFRIETALRNDNLGHPSGLT
jgi:hypothetical protein